MGTDWRTLLLAGASGGLLTAGGIALKPAAAPVVTPAPVSAPASASAPLSAPLSAPGPHVSAVAAPAAAPAAGPAVTAAKPAETAPPPAAGGKVADLFGLSPQLPVPPPSDGAPPVARWTVQVGLYPTADQAETARRSLFWLAVPPVVTQWADRRGQGWFTLSLSGLTAPGAADTASRLRQKGWDPVRVTAVPGAPPAAGPPVAEAVPSRPE